MPLHTGSGRMMHLQLPTSLILKMTRGLRKEQGLLTLVKLTFIFLEISSLDVDIRLSRAYGKRIRLMGFSQEGHTGRKGQQSPTNFGLCDDGRGWIFQVVR